MLVIALRGMHIVETRSSKDERATWYGGTHRHYRLSNKRSDQVGIVELLVPDDRRPTTSEPLNVHPLFFRLLLHSFLKPTGEPSGSTLPFPSTFSH